MISGQLKISDAELFCRLANDSRGDAGPLSLAETYNEYKDLCKEHTAWLKHYFIAAALLLASQFNVLKELGGFGAKVHEDFIPIAALLYLTVSTLAFTNFELKMRAYRLVYESELSALDPSNHLHTLLRYPLAFYGTSFAATSILSKTHLISTKDAFLSAPAVFSILVVKWIMAIGGLYVTATVFVQVLNVPEKYCLLKYTVLAAFIAVSVFSAGVLRNTKKPHVYNQK